MTSGFTITPSDATHRFDEAARLLAAAFDADPLHRAVYGADVRHAQRTASIACGSPTSAAGSGSRPVAASRCSASIHWGREHAAARRGGAVGCRCRESQLGWLDRSRGDGLQVG